MTTFDLIIRNLINLDNNIFSFNYDELDKTDGIYKFYFNILYNNSNIKGYKTKFHFLKDILDNNFYFINKFEIRVNFLFLFYKFSKI